MDFRSLKTPDKRVSVTKLLLISGSSFLLFYICRILERMLDLPDNLFVQVVPYAAGLITAVVGFLGAIHGWSKKIDFNHKEEKKDG